MICPWCHTCFFPSLSQLFFSPCVLFLMCFFLHKVSAKCVHFAALGACMASSTSAQIKKNDECGVVWGEKELLGSGGSESSGKPVGPEQNLLSLHVPKWWPRSLFLTAWGLYNTTSRPCTWKMICVCMCVCDGGCSSGNRSWCVPSTPVSHAILPEHRPCSSSAPSLSITLILPLSLIPPPQGFRADTDRALSLIKGLYWSPHLVAHQYGPQLE